MRFFCIFTLSWICLSIALKGTSSFASSQSNSVAEQIEVMFQTAVEKIIPCTVRVSSQRTSARVGVSFMIEEEGPERGPRTSPEQITPEVQIGAGVIFREDGYIITNAHVVSYLEKILVTLHDGREFLAELIGCDEASDLAVLKIPVTGLSVPTLAEQPPKVGQWALALGAPYNLENSFAVGWVSAPERRGMVWGQIVDYIQITTPLHPGNSGGPLFDIHGRILGINTLVRGLNSGIGFAIPAADAWEIGAQLIRDGFIERPWLGVRVLDIRENPNLLEDYYPSSTRGVLVESIEPGGPAASADILPFDIIQTVDARAVETPAELMAEIGRRAVGDKVRIGILRAKHQQPSQKLTVTVTLTGIGDRPDKLLDTDTTEEEATNYDELGLQVTEAREGDHGPLQGVLVKKIDEKSQLYNQGVAEGCIIHFVNLMPVTTIDSYRKAIEKTFPRSKIHVIFSCNGRKSYAIFSNEK